MEIRINYVAPSLNVWQRMNRFKRSEIKKKLVFLIFQQWLKNPEKFKKVSIDYYRPGHLDEDNLYSSFKPIGDALVKCGIIPDDGPEFLNLTAHNYKEKETLLIIKQK